MPTMNSDRLPVYRAQQFYLEESVRELGFDNWAKFQQSPQWRALRRRCLRSTKGKCNACGGHATQVFFIAIDADVLTGLRPDQLIPLCRTCYGRAGRPNERPHRKIKEAAKERIERTSANPKSGFCLSCAKNPTRKGFALCGNCQSVASDPVCRMNTTE
jgi:hypothetical protein